MAYTFTAEEIMALESVEEAVQAAVRSAIALKEALPHRMKSGNTREALAHEAGLAARKELARRIREIA